LTFAQAHAQILNNTNSQNSYPINTYSKIDPDVPFGASWVNAPYNAALNADRMWTFVFWWINKIINQESTIKEKMILFWHNLFGVSNTNSITAKTNFRYLNTLNTNALGNYKKMIKDITIEPLMLHFLNGFQNEARAPDENYARELLELFTLGKGKDSKYTEDDVKAAARVLTGFIFDPNSQNADFFRNRHDLGDKKFSTFFDNRVIKSFGQDENWTQEIFGLIDMIFEKEEVSKFICRKLYRFFINYDITEEIEQQIINPLSKTLRDNDYEILPVLRQLFGSNHFFDSENIGSMIKSPIDFLLGMFREMPFDVPNDTLVYSYFMDYLRKLLVVLKQDLPDPPNVAGWPAYYQVPSFGRAWINSETLKLRDSIIDTFLEGKNKGKSDYFGANILFYISTIKNAENPNDLINELLSRNISFKATDEFKKSLKTILLSNQDNDYYWTEAWLNYKKNPNDEITKNIVQTRLLQLLKNILHLNEYNLH
jgi:uncharacterized protein (DUF1800 family)